MTIFPTTQPPTLHTQALHDALLPLFATYTDIAAITLPQPPSLDRAGVYFEWPSGLAQLHCVLDEPHTAAALEAETQHAAEQGVDMVYWLADAGIAQAACSWCRARWGVALALDGAALVRYQRPNTLDPRAWVPLRENDPFWTVWKHLLLLRYVELWRNVIPVQALRGLAGSEALKQSLGGLIGTLNVRKTFVKGDDGAWHAPDPTALYPDLPRLPAEGIAVARARAFARRTATIASATTIAVRPSAQ